MDLQGRILLSFGLLALGIITIFVLISLRSGGPPQTQEEVQGPGYAIRRWWFLLLVAVLAAALGFTIPHYPYATAGTALLKGETAEFTVIAQQFAFRNLPAEVPLGPAVFHVTSSDVNHGFALYDPHERLLGQVQAMPEYGNSLAVTFTERGTYTVRCLEYCGLAHHLMQGTFEVR